MIENHSGTYSFHKYIATFTDNGESRSHTTSDKRYYQDMISKWGHLENLVFSPIIPTQEQQDRLDWLNSEIENNNSRSEANIYPASCTLYVKEGIVLPDEEFSILSSIANNTEIKERTLEHFRNIKRDEARHRRWEEETKGIVVNGMSVRTDDRSQNRVSQLVTTVVADEQADNFDFEVQPGQWIVVSRENAILIGKAVSQHIQACFTNCKNLHNEINNAMTLEDIESVDISKGWP